MHAVSSEPPIPVPPHLRDAHYTGAEALGHVGYRFPHDAPAGWVAQEHAPGIEPGLRVHSGRPNATSRACGERDYLSSISSDDESDSGDEISDDRGVAGAGFDGALVETIDGALARRAARRARAAGRRARASRAV